jgi:hypothetical protein
MAKSKKKSEANRYSTLLESVFFANYRKGCNEVWFKRDELVAAAKSRRVSLPKNLGDVVYSFRYRNPLPKRVLDTQHLAKNG